MKYRNTIGEILDERDELINEATHYYKYRYYLSECIRIMKERAYQYLPAFTAQELTQNIDKAIEDSAPVLWELDYIFRPIKLRNTIKDIKPIKKSIEELENLYDRAQDVKERTIRERSRAAAIALDEFTQLNNMINLFYHVRFEANINKKIAKRCDQQTIDYCFNEPAEGYEPIWELAQYDGQRFVQEVIRQKLPEPNIENIENIDE